MPIENSIEGSVSVTLDTLVFEHDLLIQREVDLPDLAATCSRSRARRSPTSRTVLSYPHAIAQCRDVAEQEAARRARSSPRTPPPRPRSEVVAARSGAGQAAIGNHARGRHLRPGEAGQPRSRTTPRTRPASCVVGRGIPAPTGHDKTSIVCFQRGDRPGLAARRSSRSSRRGRSTSPSSRAGRPSRASATTASSSTSRATSPTSCVADCLRNLAAKQAQVKFLGSYPVAGGDRATARRKAPRARRGATAVQRSTSSRGPASAMNETR